jgi:branched-subunit amino acid ABC-type transport system permease component
MKKTLAAALVLGGLMALLAGPAAAQCVMCKNALTGSAEGRGMGAQFNHAILLMVAAPYMVMGGFLLGVYRGRIGRHARRLAARIRGARAHR